MILRDIRQNRQRVEDVIKRTSLIFENEVNTEEKLKILTRLYMDELISEEQYEKLNKKVDDLDMEMIISELKNTKVGRGLSFLPNTIAKLKEKAKDWIANYAKEKTANLRTKLLAILDELLQRKAISKKEHKDKIEQHDLDLDQYAC